MKIKCHILFIIVVYAPNEVAKISKNNQIYEKFTKPLQCGGERKAVHIVGDLNARIGWKIDDPIVRQYCENIVNGNGARLTELC